MQVGFSEVQYTVAFLHELFSRFDQENLPFEIKMPTQVEEGKCGYDLRIDSDLDFIPTFWQFKVPEYLQQDNAREFSDFNTDPDHVVPYYWINIYPNTVSEQHNRLVDF